MIRRETLLAVLAMVMLSAALGGCAAPSRLMQSERQWLAGRTYVVTGASSGFGRGVALKLAGHGSNVVLAARWKLAHRHDVRLKSHQLIVFEQFA
jgi:hypothetical protein